MKYHLIVFGCQMNHSDGERFKSMLEELNYQETTNEAEADIIAVVACAIRQKAVDRIHGKARAWVDMKAKRPLITALSGCVVKEDRTKLKDVFDIFFEIKDLPKFPQLLAQHVEGLPEITAPENFFKIKPKYSSPFQAFVPIATGCNNYCTFCVVPYTRGKEVSRPFEEILDECRKLTESGVKEITLLGQNVNSYGLDDLPPRMITPEGRVRFRNELAGRKTFPDLLQAVADLPGDFWVRFITSNPQDFDYRLIDVVADHPKIPTYIHLPIQAGNDEVLRRMNRRYTRGLYSRIVQRIRRRIPDVTLTTDIIVGFCGENDMQFRDTMEAVEEYAYDMAFTAQYSHRPGTGAFRAFVDDISREEKAERERRLTNVLRQTAHTSNQRLLGTTQRVLVERYKNGRNLARTGGMKPVNFAGPSLVGQFADVTITVATPWHLEAELPAKAVHETPQPVRQAMAV